MCLRVSDVTVCLAINQSSTSEEIRNHTGVVRGGFCRLRNLGNIQWLGLLSMLSQRIFVDRGIQSASMQASYQSLSTQQKRHRPSSNGSPFTDIKHSYEKWQNFISSLRMTPHQCVLRASQQVYIKKVRSSTTANMLHDRDEFFRIKSVKWLSRAFYFIM